MSTPSAREKLIRIAMIKSSGVAGPALTSF